ncbi:unnamed protein product [Oreochromis niloticus]|nr:unnamed protein product [Mustela putorius furo]
MSWRLWTAFVLDKWRVALGRHVFQNLQNRLVQFYQQQPLDLDHIDFLCVNASTLVCSLSAHINVPSLVVEALHHLICLIHSNMDTRRSAIVVDSSAGERGRAKLYVSKDHLKDLKTILYLQAFGHIAENSPTKNGRVGPLNNGNLQLTIR